MDPVSTELFRFLTPASPEQVWAALTRADLTARYFYGLHVDCSWQPGAPLTFRDDTGRELAGQLLAVRPPERLSYTLEDSADGTTAYISWQIRAVDGGSVVRLYVDEPDPGPDAARQVEEAWLPLLSALQALLATPHLDRKR